jgi:hypothetical protein
VGAGRNVQCRQVGLPQPVVQAFEREIGRDGAAGSESQGRR